MSPATVVPAHIGLILDGNRRWAKANGLPTLAGHDRGYDTFIKVAPAFFERGVKYLSAFIFSTENWRRTQQEVSYLMGLFHKLAKDRLQELDAKNIRALFLGRHAALDKKLTVALEAAEAKTKDNSGGTVAFCLNYGGTYEIADAVKAIVAAKAKAEDIEPALITKHLYHPELPKLDLVVRTSGEQRLSNFMLWRAAYAELMFLDKHWPDVDESDVEAILAEYAERQRRFGK